MCGICGSLSFDGDSVDRSTLERMNEALFHRGPDSGGVFVEDGVGLAARRLAIIDLVAGDQPIRNEDGTVVVVQNGEIYNYRELRAELERRGGHQFTTHSDTEVLVHLYEEHGLAFVERLRGMFAIALWDAKQRRLVVARDQFGIKPLYYRLRERSLEFASELKALLTQPDFSREIDLDALDAFLAFGFVPAPLTIFRQAKKLPPASMLICDGDGPWRVRVEAYARPRPGAADEVRPESEQDLAQELCARLRDSVRAHLIADVPVGVFLSGGIDSSLIVALAAEVSSDPVKTFTVGFEERHFDERGAARLIADRYATDHHELVMRPDAVALLPALSEVFDEPFADASAIPTFLISQLARQHVKVALSGEGGDEFFGGYNYYVGHRLAPLVGGVAGAMRPLVERLPSSSAKSSTLDWQAKRFARAARLGPVERHYAWKTYIAPEERMQLVLPDRRPSLDPVELLRARYSETEGADELARVMDIDVGIFLVDDMLVKTDRASMAHSLEARVPILDTEVADLAFALPSRLKVRAFSKKRLLKRAADGLVPRRILNGEKRGFAIPRAAWLRGELRPFVDEVLSEESLRRQGFFEPRAVARLVDDHMSHRIDNGRKIWCLLVFGLWFERYAGRAA
jgi:asparagine synthase (glutamine-hydrolysing)